MLESLYNKVTGFFYRLAPVTPSKQTQEISVVLWVAK